MTRYPLLLTCSLSLLFFLLFLNELLRRQLPKLRNGSWEDPIVWGQRVFQHPLHSLRIGHKVGRGVASVELHPLNDIEGCLDRKSTRLNSSSPLNLVCR